MRTPRFSNGTIIDLYSDFLICFFGQATATSLSSILDNTIKHDTITRMLKNSEIDSKYLWIKVKKIIRKIENNSGVLIFDDTIVEKVWSHENEINTWHFDHCKNKSVKGINIMTGLYHILGMSIPVAFEITKKTEEVKDEKTGKMKRKSKISKQELFRNMISQMFKNQLSFTYVLADKWFSNNENMNFIEKTINKFFIFPLKNNRLVAESEADAKNGKWKHLDEINCSEVRKVWLRGLEFPVALCKITYQNTGNSEATLYLASNDLTLNQEQFLEIYQRRWKVEEYHKNLKSNLGIGNSPCHTVKTQQNHCGLAILAFVKIEQLSLAHETNPFALKQKLRIAGSKKAWEEYQKMKKIIKDNSLDEQTA